MTSFMTVIREERFFCTLLVHACLSDEPFSDRFVHRLAEVSRTPLGSGGLELYTEVAWLRDYWYQLGDFRTYSAELHQRRREQLLSVLEVHLGDADLAARVIEAHFTETTKGRIQSPGRWDVKEIESFTTVAATERDQGDPLKLRRKLCELKWAYNAKPDLLVIGDRVPVLIEAKVESGIDYKKTTGYNQARISQTIRRLMHVVSDAVVDTQHEVDFSGITFISKKQQKDPESGSDLPTIKWSEIASWAESSTGLDSFTRDGLLRFARRAQAGALEVQSTDHET